MKPFYGFRFSRPLACFLPLVLFFGGIGAAAAMTQLLGSF